MTFELLKSLCEKSGIPSREKSAVCAIKSHLSNFSCVTDVLGNLIVTVKEPKQEEKTVLLEAHVDRVGLVVTSFLDGGFVRVAKAGGVDSATLMGSEIYIRTKTGEQVIGNIAAPFPHPAKPHNSAPASEYKMPDITEMYVDTGLENPKEQISLGAECVLKGKVEKLVGSHVAAPCLDNRAGCAAVIMAANELASMDLNCGFKLLFSSREEIGGMGAITGSFYTTPDYAIVVDAGFAISPDVTEKDGSEMGKGPEIDISTILDETLTNTIIDIAKEKEIPYQLLVTPSRGTGTDADGITTVGVGIKTALISIPVRFMHQPVEVVDLEDMINTTKLLVEIVKGVNTNNA